MFSTSFRRPIGAAADAKELEYITALHQTCDEDEEDYVDGSIEAKDVKYYLMSRYGILVETEQIQKLVFQDLAGGSDDSDCIDICELVAILLIPFFVKNLKGDMRKSFTGKESIYRAFGSEKQFKSYLKDVERCNNLLSKGDVIIHVLNIILADSTGSSKPQPITKELIKTIFARYGEFGLIQDEQLIDEMILDVSGGNPNALLDANTFARALTDDVMLYNVDYESRVSTFSEDVFGREGEENTKDFAEGSDDNSEDSDNSETNPLRTTLNNEEDPESNHVVKSINKRFKNVFTLSQIDFLADSCRSKLHLAIIYLSFVFSVFTYRKPTPINVCKAENSNEFGCTIANSITFWLYIMGMTMGIGVPWILLISAGNTLRGNSTKNILYGFVGIIFFTILPIYVPFNLMLFSSAEYHREDEGKSMGQLQNLKILFFQVIKNLIAVVLCFIQITNLIRIFKPSLAHSSNLMLSYLFTRGTVRETFLLKLACSLKTHMMVKNALDLHFEGENLNFEDMEPTETSTNALALLNYSKVVEKTETIGGLWWCWKGYITRSLVHREGVMVNSRLILCNVLQFFLVIIMMFEMPTFTLRNVSPILFPTLSHSVNACDESTFDPNKCYFLNVGGVPSGMAVCYGVKMESSCISDNHFEPVLKNLGDPDHGNDNRLDLMCDGVNNLSDIVNGTVWSLIHYGDDSEEFINVSTAVVGTVLCEGLEAFNYTIWDAYFNAANSTDLDSCDAPQESYDCDAALGKYDVGSKYQYVMDLLLLSYREQYRRTMQSIVECLHNPTTTNYVLAQATASLQNTLGSAMQASWSALFSDSEEIILSSLNIDELVKNWLISTMSSEVADQIITDNLILNKTDITSRISAPVLSSTSNVVAVEEAAMKLVDSVFLELNNTLVALKLAVESNLSILPPYMDLPYLPVTAICENIWTVRPNVTLLLESLNSTQDHYCRAGLTACTKNGICLMGLDIITRNDRIMMFPFQFSGNKCREYEDLERIMESKDLFGQIQTYIPSLMLINSSIWIAVFISIIALLGVAILFIPSAILTSLKYRSGVLPSLRNQNFNMYRENLISLTFLVPVVLWSAFFMCFVVFFAVFLAVFILLWNATRIYLVQAAALIIGEILFILLVSLLSTP